MANSPKEAMEKMERAENAWKNIKPEKRFGGMTFEEYKVFPDASRNARILIANLDNQMTEALALRDLNDEQGLARVQLIKNGVLADAEEGEDSALYEAMGYVKKSDKKSGLTRKKKAIKA